MGPRQRRGNGVQLNAYFCMMLAARKVLQTSLQETYDAWI